MRRGGRDEEGSEGIGGEGGMRRGVRDEEEGVRRENTRQVTKRQKEFITFIWLAGTLHRYEYYCISSTAIIVTHLRQYTSSDTMYNAWIPHTMLGYHVQSLYTMYNAWIPCTMLGYHVQMLGLCC